jgi:hypothetical protein
MTGCDALWPDTYWRSERYVVLAVDSPEQMSLAFDTGEGAGALVLVGATIFAVGADERYIVVKQHPNPDGSSGSLDRSVTNYYVVTRTQSTHFSDRERGVRGPMTQTEFEALCQVQALPRFSKRFRNLE